MKEGRRGRAHVDRVICNGNNIDKASRIFLSDFRTSRTFPT